MKYRTCHECGNHGMAIVKVGQKINRLCLDCLVKLGRGWAYRRYICSVASCQSFPSHLVVVDDEGLRSLLVCAEHYAKMRTEVRSVVPLPDWLADEDDIILDEEGITVQLELFSKLDADHDGEGPD